MNESIRLTHDVVSAKRLAGCYVSTWGWNPNKKASVLGYASGILYDRLEDNNVGIIAYILSVL